MIRQFLNFLNGKKFTDVDKVNALFVTTFVKCNGLSVKHNKLLLKYLLAEEGVSIDFLKQLVKNKSVLTLEDLTRLFEFVVSPADRVVTGAIYTPKYIRDTILNKCFRNKNRKLLRTIRVADISCGCGGFLMDVASYIHRETEKSYFEIFKDNIFGIDIQYYAIERTKILLSLLALSNGEDANFEFNLMCRDTLDFACNDWDIRYSEFDLIVGNPPYVCSRNLSEETHKKLKKYEVCGTGHPDLYIPFFQIAIEMLNKNGRLGYITMNTFLRSVNGRAIRSFFSKNRFSISIVDFRGYQIFESKNTYTCLFYLDKRHRAEVLNYTVDEQGELSGEIRYNAIPYNTLDDEKGWHLNDFGNTTAIETTGIQIKDYCPSRHGIATLNNDTFIFRPVAVDEKYFYLELDGKMYPIEKEICRDIINPNKLNSTENIDLFKEKVIFPYRIEQGRAIVFNSKEMSYHYPKALSYLLSRKNILLERDKGNTSKYPQWYAFGRTQSLIMPRYKLFFPKFANKPLRCVVYDDSKLMLYNGLAFVNSDKRKLMILKRIIESKLFWRYIQKNAKPYASGYYSLSGVDIKHFGIPILSLEEENELLAINDKTMIESWLKNHYKTIE